jgi:hypothetical protein
MLTTMFLALVLMSVHGVFVPTVVGGQSLTVCQGLVEGVLAESPSARVVRPCAPYHLEAGR